METISQAVELYARTLEGKVLSTRARNILAEKGIDTPEQAVEFGLPQLKRTIGVSARIRQQIEDWVHANGLEFGKEPTSESVRYLEAG